LKLSRELRNTKKLLLLSWKGKKERTTKKKDRPGSPLNPSEGKKPEEIGPLQKGGSRGSIKNSKLTALSPTLRWGGRTPICVFTISNARRFARAF